MTRRRQVAEAVGSSSHLTPRWREMDSNFRFLVARPSNRHRRGDCFLETWSGSVGEREVRIHLPPAVSQVRTRPHGFGNLPPSSHAPAPPIASIIEVFNFCRRAALDKGTARPSWRSPINVETAVVRDGHAPYDEQNLLQVRRPRLGGSNERLDCDRSRRRRHCHVGDYGRQRGILRPGKHTQLLQSPHND